MLKSKGDECDVREILSNPELGASILFEAEELISFFVPSDGAPTPQTEEHLDKIVTWALTDEELRTNSISVCSANK